MSRAALFTSVGIALLVLDVFYLLVSQDEIARGWVDPVNLPIGLAGLVIPIAIIAAGALAIGWILQRGRLPSRRRVAAWVVLAGSYAVLTASTVLDVVRKIVVEGAPWKMEWPIATVTYGTTHTPPYYLDDPILLLSVPLVVGAAGGIALLAQGRR